MVGEFSGYGCIVQPSQLNLDPDLNFDLHGTQAQFQQSCDDHMMTCPPTSGQNFGEHMSSAQDEEVQEIDAGQFVDDTGNKKGTSHRGKAFLPQEDRVIVSGWLNISKDAATGTSQTSSAFYARLHRYFLENWDMQSHRTQLSVQNRWVSIRKAVSKFQGILSAIQRRYESGKTDQDKVNDAIRAYEQTKPWQFAHCWEILRNEPKWNDYLVECSKPKHGGQANQAPAGSNTPTEPLGGGHAPIERPEGRDSAKRRRAKATIEDSGSSVALEMLQKIHDRGQQMDELDAKHKDELLAVERAKLDLQEKALLAKIQQGDKKIELQRELSLENIRLQRESLEVSRLQTETQIMFTDLSACHPSMRFWVAKKQRDILMKEGINPAEVESAAAASHNDLPSGQN